MKIKFSINKFLWYNNRYHKRLNKHYVCFANMFHHSTFRVQLYYFSFLWQWNEDECVACHRRFVLYFPTFLLYFSFLPSLCSFATLISSFELKVWFTRKSKLNLLLIKMYHAYAHMLHSLSMNYIPSNYALQPWIQNFLKLSKSLKEETSGNFSKTK